MDDIIRPLFHPEVKFWQVPNKGFAVFDPTNRGILMVNRMTIVLLMESDGERTMDKMLSDIYKSYNLEAEYDEEEYRKYAIEILEKFMELGLIRNHGKVERFLP